MRALLTILLVLIVAWGVYEFLDDASAPPTPRTPLPDLEPAPQEPHRPVARYATVVVHLIGPDQAPIPDGEVGTEIGGAVRWVPATRKGTRTYTDLEPGIVRILGRAPGRVDTEQRRSVTAGVRADVRLVLRPRK